MVTDGGKVRGRKIVFLIVMGFGLLGLVVFVGRFFVVLLVAAEVVVVFLLVVFAAVVFVQIVGFHWELEGVLVVKLLIVY